MAHIEEVLLPRALMMGVNYDLFWTLNPKSLTPFIKAFELKMEHEDTTSWQNGLYVRLAVLSIMDSKIKYPNKPLSVKEKVVKDDDEEMIANKKMNKIKQAMLERMSIVNHNLNKEGISDEQ